MTNDVNDENIPGLEKFRQLMREVRLILKNEKSLELCTSVLVSVLGSQIRNSLPKEHGPAFLENCMNETLKGLTESYVTEDDYLVMSKEYKFSGASNDK